MAHFAELDNTNRVIRVIVVANEDILDENGNESEEVGIAFCRSLLGEHTNWVQTSYNKNFRKHFAGIGCYYDKIRDAFIAPCPHPSWILNEDTCMWEAPIVHPRELNSTDEGAYVWNEAKQTWDSTE